MTKVITYGTYDLLHYGHIKLLERAKELGDYLIVGVTADDFDRKRGKINVQQSLMERIEGIRRTGLADEIIVEEYEGQKIDDIKKYGVDIFTVGSDWVGKFDYLGEFCKVVYLQRTQGVSSSAIRAEKNDIRIGIIGSSVVIDKFIKECGYVNGIKIVGICSENYDNNTRCDASGLLMTNDYDRLLEEVDAMYIVSLPTRHYSEIKRALQRGKHVLCESPVAVSVRESDELYAIAKEKKLVLVDAIKTAYSTAYSRMILLVKGGAIGDVVSIDTVCTSLCNVDYRNIEYMGKLWNSITSWGPTALLPIFHILGDKYDNIRIATRIGEESLAYDEFTRISLEYPGAVATAKVGKGVKSEGEMIISGTRGYVYIPAPWWKTDYFEIRYENPSENKRYFYQLDGEGIRNEVLSFIRLIDNKGGTSIPQTVSRAISRIMENFATGESVIRLKKD